MAVGNVIGYARVSTKGQSLESQIDALVAAGAITLFQEYLAVTDLTRLGRSTADLAAIVTTLGERGVGFRSLAAGPQFGPNDGQIAPGDLDR